MTFCLMFPLTLLGLVAIGIGAPFVYGALRSRLAAVRAGVPVVIPAVRRLAPAASAAVLAAIVSAAVAYGWAEAEPCGNRPASTSSEPAIGAILACR